MNKLILYALGAFAVWYFFFKDTKKPCCAGCADGTGCAGAAPSGDGATDQIQTGAEKGFFYDTTKSKWVKKQPARFIDDDLSSF